MPKKASSLHKLKPIKWNNYKMPPSNEKPVPHLEPEPVPAPALAPTPVPEPIPVPVPAALAPAVAAAPAPELAPLDSEGEGEIPPSSSPSSVRSSSTNSGGSNKSRKRKSSEMSNSAEAESSGPKHKKKVTWTSGLHNLFLVAIRHIGLDKAVPKKILEIMNVPNLTRENVASHLQKYRIFLRKVTEKGILEGLSERTLRSKFAAELPIDMIKEMQASVEKLNNTKIFIPTTPLMQALLGRSYPLFYNNNNNGVANNNNTPMYPQNYAQPPPPPMGINNNNNLQNQSCYGNPMMYNNQIQNYAQLPPMGNNNNYQHQSYDLGMGNMVSMGNPNNINNNNMAFMNAAPPSYYPNFNFGGEILGVQGHGGFNNNNNGVCVGVGGGGGGATTPIPISNNNYNNSNVDGFGFMGEATIQNSNNNINGNYPPAMVQGYYAPPQPPTPPAGGGGYYAPPPPPAAAVINNNGIDIMRKHACAQNNSGGRFSSQSITTVSAGSNEDHPIQVDDNVLSNLFYMLEDMRLLQQSEQAAKNQEFNNAFFMPANSSTCSNVMQSPYQQVGGNQVPDDFFDFSGSANVMQQTQISGDVIVPSAENIMNLQTQLPITTNDYIPIQMQQEDIGFLDIETSGETFTAETGSTITTNSVSQQDWDMNLIEAMFGTTAN